MAVASIVSDVGNAISAAGNAISTASNISAAISQGASSGNLLSAIRSIDLPRAGEAVGDVLSSIATFSDNNSNDWRARLSLPPWVSFRSSPAFKPLIDAGGLIFPYTPNIQIASTAKYTPVSPVHANYSFQAFQNSDPGKITITAPMNVEDPTQALYWVAALHFLRSLTKMFSGNDPKAGNPPPIVYFNAYGGYVFKNVPVVVTSFSTNLLKDCDYIPVNVSGSMAGQVSSITNSISGLAGSIGQTVTGLNSVASSISNLAGGIGQASGLLGSFGLGGTVSGGVAYVPTKSEFSIDLQPVYSRNNVRNFSLDVFVTGGYLNNYFGYV